MEIWINPECSKCRSALTLLDAEGADYTVRYYLEQPPTAQELVEVLARLGLQPWDITRLGEPIAEELGLASWPRDEAGRPRWIDALATHPALIQRPIITADDGTAAVARSPEAVRAAIATSGALADDPFGDRRPTSHERLTGLSWDASYHDGPAPWDIGRPQPAIVRLASEGGFVGAVLDAGCGTGENALHVASLGLPVLGVDVAETALATARAKADERGVAVEFAAADAFRLERLGRRFDTVLDCGLFHTFDGDERPGYVASLAAVTERDGTLYVLCFSDDGPDLGPHPVGREELRAAFNPGSGWNVAAIEPGRVLTRFHDDGAPAWLATINRI